MHSAVNNSSPSDACHILQDPKFAAENGRSQSGIMSCAVLCFEILGKEGGTFSIFHHSKYGPGKKELTSGGGGPDAGIGACRNTFNTTDR